MDDVRVDGEVAGWQDRCMSVWMVNWMVRYMMK